MPNMMLRGKPTKYKQKFSVKVLKLAREIYMEHVKDKKMTYYNFSEISEAYTRIAVFLEQLPDSEVRRRIPKDFKEWYFDGYFQQMYSLLKAQK